MSKEFRFDGKSRPNTKQYAENYDRIFKKEKGVRYKNYRELLEAYKSGELKEPLMLDNDDCHVYVGDECVFQGGGQMDVEEIAEAGGFIVEWV